MTQAHEALSTGQPPATTSALFAARPEFDAFAAAICEQLDVPVATVTFIDREGDRQFYAGQAGLPEPLDSVRETPMSYSFCRHVVDASRPISVIDLRLDARMRDIPSVSEFGITSYAGFPVRDADGRVVGTVCAMDMDLHVWSLEELTIIEHAAEACSAILVAEGTVGSRGLSPS